MKRCYRCEEVKQFEEFFKNRSKKDGLSTECKSCQKIYTANWARNNPEKRKEICKKYNKSDKRRANYKRFFISRAKEGGKLERLNYARRYVRGALQKQGIIEIDEELIQMKRDQMMAHRAYIKIRKEINNEERIYGG
jgi:hypothetical protein